MGEGESQRLTGPASGPPDATLDAPFAPEGAMQRSRGSAPESVALKQLDPKTSSSSLAVGEVIGEGGMGVVRVATQRSLARRVAIKTARPGATTKDAQRMLREAWVTGFLEHPGVVPVYDIVRGDDEAPIVVMRRIQGTTWEARMRDPSWAEQHGARDLLEQNLRVFVRVCEIVEFAHAKGVIHRDVKPANVMVGSFGEVYLLDWGLAIALHGEASEHLPGPSHDDAVAGTLAYASPEMIGLVKKPLSERTDVYLLGAVLFEIVTGLPPHDRGSPSKTLESIASTPPPLGPDVPARLAASCTRAMQKDPDARFAAAADVRHAVLDFLRSRDSERLVAEAEKTLAKLRDACKEGALRRQIYDLYGECRFAFREARRTWPENDAAARGLAEAASLVIEHELGRDPRVAMALLDEVPAVPEDLAKRVRAAVAAEDEERRGLSQLARDHDQTVGRGARVIFFGLCGAIWSLSQLFGDLLGRLTHPRFGFGTLLQIALTILVWRLFPAELRRTVFNRRVFWIVCLTLAAQAGLFFGTWVLGIPIPQVRVLQIGVWAVVGAASTITLERRLWPMALGLAAAYAASVFWPGGRSYFGTLATAGVTLNIVFLWGRRPSEEQPARLARREDRSE